jgi:hypothetical protein
MLLRRVIEHVREQNWTAVGIDFLIVVIGVFVGIQVANWNTERERTRESAVFTARLKDDLRAVNWRYRLLVDYAGQVRAAAGRAADALDGTAPLSNEEFLVNAYRATQYKGEQGSNRRGTYDQLISTGNIRLIRDEALLHIAVRAYTIDAVDSLVREGVNSRYRELFRMSIDHRVQQTLGARCGDRYLEPGEFEGMSEVLDYPCTTGLPTAVIDAAAEALRADPNTLRYLRVRIADLGTRLVDMTGNARDVYDGLQAIAEEAP